MALDDVYTGVYPNLKIRIYGGDVEMGLPQAKVFKSGNSQAIRIPKGFYTTGDDLAIQKVGNALILTPSNDPWGLFKQSLGEFSDDFFKDGRKQPDMQERAVLFEETD
jgi:antitoxin VapB